MAQPVNIPPTITLNTSPTNQSVPLFGAQSNVNTKYPNDCVQIDLYNINSVYLESIARGTVASIQGTQITLNPERDLVDANYISGKYNITYRFLRNQLGSSDAHKLAIQEISNDRLEIRVVPFLTNDLSNVNFVNFFGSGFFQQQKSVVLPNLYIYTSAIDRIGVFDYIQDNLTITESPFSIIFKLSTPLPNTSVIGDLLWLSQEVSAPVTDNLIIIPPQLKRVTKTIAGPNFDVLVKQRVNQQTSFKNWNDLITTSSANIQSVVNRILSGSTIEGVPLNVDYRKFDNFVFFGSATERLLNFKYKVQLLESYDARIAQLTTDLSGLASSNSTGSFFYTKNVTDARNKKAALLGAFDGYEKYLYYASHSYETSSYGEFYPATWPKQTSQKPYALYHSTSSQAEEWFDGIISSASIYDYNNANNLQKLIPEHIQLDSSNESYVLFVNMIGHYYDLIYGYIKEYTRIYDRNEGILEGFSKDLIYAVSQNLGIDFENGAAIEDLWEYAIGVDQTGSYISGYQVSSEDRVKETWKRVLANLPYLIKTKGTERSIRALINCYGLPATILRIREYGGPEPEFTTKTDLKYERFFYDLSVGQSNGSDFSKIQTPWRATVETGRRPDAVQLRFKIPKGDRRTQTIMESEAQWQLRAFPSGSGDYIGFFLNGGGGAWATASVSCSVFDGNYHSATIMRSVEDDTLSADQTYKLVVKKTNYQKVVQTATASFFVEGATSASYNQRYIANGLISIPAGNSTVLGSGDYFTGSVQELRYWAKAIDDSVLDNHALAPTNYQGDLDSSFTGTTSSFYNLIYRQTFGSDNKKYDHALTSSLFSKHPNQAVSTFASSVIKSSSFVNFLPSASTYYNPVTEFHSLEWPDLGGNRSVSNKIRIEPTLTVGTGLYTNRSIQRSLTDTQPPDSPRLGVFLSPQNEINQDIAEQFGGISIDDYIGDPQDVYREYYPDLANLSNEYYKKYTAHNLYNNYIRIIKHYDASLFQLIKKLAPHRANLQTGLVIEPSILERSKFATNKPVVDDLLLTSSLDIPDVYVVGGAIQDADGDVRDQGDYVWQTEIDLPYQELTGSYDYLEGQLSGSALNIQMYQYEYNNQQVEQQLDSEERLDDTIDTAISAYGRDTRVDGSQYWFYTWNRSGSEGFVYVPSVRYDYAEGVQPTIYDNTTSQYQRVINYDLPPGVVILPNGTAYYDFISGDI